MVLFHYLCFSSAKLQYIGKFTSSCATSNSKKKLGLQRMSKITLSNTITVVPAEKASTLFHNNGQTTKTFKVSWIVDPERSAASDCRRRLRANLSQFQRNCAFGEKRTETTTETLFEYIFKVEGTLAWKEFDWTILYWRNTSKIDYKTNWKKHSAVASKNRTFWIWWIHPTQGENKASWKKQKAACQVDLFVRL